jgi:hypothetical protein
LRNGFIGNSGPEMELVGIFNGQFSSFSEVSNLNKFAHSKLAIASKNFPHFALKLNN